MGTEDLLQLGDHHPIGRTHQGARPGVIERRLSSGQGLEVNGWKGSSPPGRSVGVSVVFLVELCCAVFFWGSGRRGKGIQVFFGNWESEGLLLLERYKEGQDIVLFVKKR